MRAGVRRGVQRAVNPRRTAPGRRSAGSWCRGFPRPRHRVAVSHRRYQAGGEQSCVRSAPLAVAQRLSARGVSIGTRGAGAPQSPAQNSREDRDGSYRRKSCAGGRFGRRHRRRRSRGAGGARVPRSHAPTLTAPRPKPSPRGSAPPAVDRRVSPERSAAALSAAPAEAQRPCSGGSRVLAVAVIRLWREFNL
jgi:hypothetical protein